MNVRKTYLTAVVVLSSLFAMPFSYQEQNRTQSPSNHILAADGGGPIPIPPAKQRLLADGGGPIPVPPATQQSLPA